MKEYAFTLKFTLPNEAVDASEYIEMLAVAGCDDALVGIGQKGCIALDFVRESVTAYDAI